MAKSVLKDIVVALAEKHGLTQREAQLFMNSLINVLNDGLRDEKLVKVKGLGTFKVIDVKDRASVNVKTGERIVIEGRGKITFAPDSVMKDLVNKPFSQFETVVLNEGVEFADTEELPEDEDIKSVDEGTDADNEAQTGDVEEASVMQPLMQKSEEPAETVVVQETEEAKIQPVEELNQTIEEPNQAIDEPNQTIDEPNQLDVPPTDDVETPDEPENDHQEAPTSEEEPPLPDEESKAAAQENTEPAQENEAATEETDSNKKDKDNKTETDNQETDMEEKSNFWGRLLSYIIVALIALGAGYYMGMKNNKVYIPMGNSEMINGEFVDSTATDSLHRLDSINEAREARIKARVDSLTKVREARNESINAKMNAYSAVKAAQPAADEGKPSAKEQPKTAEVPAKPAASAEQKPVQLPQGDNSQALKTAKQMVNTGAYVIVGTQETITVRADQTMKKISKFYLGDGMECYIQAYNGVAEVKEGMKLRIPKLQVKKKK